MATAEQVRQALAVVADSHPDEARVIRQHLDGLLVHPMALAQYATGVAKTTSHHLGDINTRLETVERHIQGVLDAEAERLSAEARVLEVEAAERQAELERRNESGRWLRDGASSVAAWMGENSKAAFTLVIGAIATYIAMRLGVAP